jgi:hypothetical protein
MVVNCCRNIIKILFITRIICYYLNCVVNEARIMNKLQLNDLFCVVLMRFEIFPTKSVQIVRSYIVI